MNNSKVVVHLALLWVEFGLLYGLGLSGFYFCDDWSVFLVHRDQWRALAEVAGGLSLMTVACVYWFGWLRNAIFAKRSSAKGVFLMLLPVGCCGLLIGVLETCAEYPEWVRARGLDNERRIGGTLKAVPVRFDPNGGVCADVLRLVPLGGLYGENVNVYPSDDERCFAHAKYAHLSLPNRCLSATRKNRSAENDFADYFTTNLVVEGGFNGVWTYVVDIEEFEGEIANWMVGQTLETNQNVYAQLTMGRIGPPVRAGETKFLVLKSTPWADKCNLLDRAYIHVKPGQSFMAKYRVSLFAGQGVTNGNYRFVAPGQAIGGLLPVPNRQGYRFAGWYDGDRRIDETTRLERNESHVLTAHWMEL